MTPSFLTAFAAGVLSFLSPCILPLIPVYLGVLSGGSENGRQWTAVRRAFFFSMGFSVIFGLLGVSAWAVGRFLLRERALFMRIGGAVVLVLGLYQLGFLRILPLHRERRLRMPEGGSDLGALLMGLVFAFGWTPCVGPVLAGILAMAGNTASALQSASLLAAYSAGLALPFLSAALSYDMAQSWLRKLGKYAHIFEKLGGFLLLVLGLLLLTGRFGAFMRLAP